MSLGNFFPADFARTQIERQLQPGMVVKFEAQMDDGELHEKRFVILDATDSTFTCVINSQISTFITSRPHMALCQVPIDQANHLFMSWDSHIDCSRIRKYTKSEVLDQLCKNPAWILGMVSNDVLTEISSAIGKSKMIPKAISALCCASLEKVIQS
ncbi:hypothetical protein [Pseudomonas sp. NBRC 111138]|uniref:hypothetical protein n=1 Tax=Pseudomonas sp. NBRC 111138 TaxID=1661053 RepID=UPI0006D3C180|nr:hypothetical protein [Pseudomonas sp. NBRC 111138]